MPKTFSLYEGKQLVLDGIANAELAKGAAEARDEERSISVRWTELGGGESVGYRSDGATPWEVKAR